MMNQPYDQPYDWQSRNLEEVSGIFRNDKDLQRALDELDRLNLREDVSVLMTDQTRDYYGDRWGAQGERRDNDKVVGTDDQGRPIERHSKAPEGATTGGLTGGVLGAIIGGLTMVGSVLIPGAGLLVAGPLIGALTGGAIGTAAGGLVGALVGAGIPEDEAKFYEKSLKDKGNVLVVAHMPSTQTEEVRAIFKRCGAESVRVS